MSSTTTKYDLAAADRIHDRGQLIREVELEYPWLKERMYLGLMIQMVLGMVRTPIA
jgi:hypothetical protein